MIKNLDQLKAMINIKEVVQTYIPLKKMSGVYKAICPFHSEKTPSFVINEQKGLFHCFGCKEGGDSFKFVEKFKHYDFNEAVREIADLYNFELEFDGQKAKIKKDYFEFYARLNTAFRENLRKNEKVLNWLYKRGLQESDLIKYDVGLVPDIINLRSLIGSEMEIALELGFCTRHSKSGEIFSPFANRLSLALRNTIFKIVGFAGRTQPYFNFHNTAKYINSRDSFLYHKSNFLYNLNFAKNAFFKKEDEPRDKRLIIVEGYFDSIALNRLGFGENVASCGTAFNQTHLATLLKCGIDKFAICFDKDDAGRKANLKACELLFKHGFFESEIWQIVGEFKDLGEVLEKNATPHFEKINAFEYYIRETLRDLQTARDKDKFLKAILKSINRQNNFYLKDFCLGVLEKITGFTFKVQQKVSLKRVNFDAEKALYKTILSDKIAQEIAKELLNSAYFENYEASFKHFKNSGQLDNAAAAVLADENVAILDREDFESLCFSFKRTFLEKMLEKAKIAQNIEQIIALQGQIQQMSAVAEVF